MAIERSTKTYEGFKNTVEHSGIGKGLLKAFDYAARMIEGWQDKELLPVVLIHIESLPYQSRCHKRPWPHDFSRVFRWWKRWIRANVPKGHAEFNSIKSKVWQKKMAIEIGENNSNGLLNKEFGRQYCRDKLDLFLDHRNDDITDALCILVIGGKIFSERHYPERVSMTCAP